VRLGPIDSQAIIGPTVLASDDDDTDVEQLVERELAGETEILGETSSRCNFVYHKSNKT
jgi:hypothetical protein